MSGDVWEHLVEIYLTRHRAVFVSPSYLIGEPGAWNACIDFLALDFSENAIWAVEVTAGAGFGKIGNKAREFDEKYAPRIRDQLNHDGMRMTDLMGWSIGLWAFVRSPWKNECERQLSKTVRHWKVTDLEETAFQWEYWDDRHRPMPPDYPGEPPRP